MEKIEDNPTVNTSWSAIQVAAWTIFLGKTVIYMIILGVLHCCDWLEERSRTRVKVIIAAIFVVSTITIFLLFLLGTWLATLTKTREDAWHFLGSFAIYIINGIWAFPAILRYGVGGRKLTNRWRQHRGRNVLHQVQIELQNQVAPAPVPAAIPAAVLVLVPPSPPSNDPGPVVNAYAQDIRSGEVLQVGNVAGLGDHLGSLNPNPPGGVATVPIVVSAAQYAVFLAEGGEVGGSQS
jgi:hypothetical protein